LDDLTHAGIALKAERSGPKSHRRQPETIVNANRHGRPPPARRIDAQLHDRLIS
jgi:hypothetical protein